ncbi:MAG: ETC complex I subunit [Methylocystis sp.]
MTACIYRPEGQSVESAKRPWRLRFDPESPRAIDPLMGWTSSSDMRAQVKLRFSTKEEAIAYAEREGIPYRVDEPKPNIAWRRLQSYADNFKPTRKDLWTH